MGPGGRCCPSSLYTFPAKLTGLGSGFPSSGFPDFEQFCIAGFPGEHSIYGIKSGASADSATPA